MKLKVCGMRYPDNLLQVSQLEPDYLGFIFYETSPRYMVDTLSSEAVRSLPSGIQRVGVFLNATTAYMLTMADRYGLHALQLHGQEPPEQCQTLREQGYTIIKVFSLGSESFDFNQLAPYQSYVDFFLFDTKGKQPGGNGQTFDWKLLQKYSLDTPFFLSGGIGLNEVSALRQLSLPQLYALDVNSRFETEPGRKDTRQLNTFVQALLSNSET